MLCAARPSGWGGTLRKLPRGCSLEGRSHVVQFGGLLQRRYADDRALVRDRGDQAVRRELTNRLPDRRAGNADALGQLTLDQALAGTQARLHDLLAQKPQTPVGAAAHRYARRGQKDQTHCPFRTTLSYNQAISVCWLSIQNHPARVNASCCSLSLSYPPLTRNCAQAYTMTSMRTPEPRAQLGGAE